MQIAALVAIKKSTSAKMEPGVGLICKNILAQRDGTESSKEVSGWIAFCVKCADMTPSGGCRTRRFQISDFRRFAAIRSLLVVVAVIIAAAPSL